MFSTYNSSDYCFKNLWRNWRKVLQLSVVQSKAFVQNCLFNCSCVFENRTELFELTGAVFVIVVNYHSQFLV